MSITEATGAKIQIGDLIKETEFVITRYGAVSGGCPVENTKAINRAVREARAAGGGTVVVPEGEFKTYTILLQSHVNVRLEKGAVLRAARTEITQSYEKQRGEGGNYMEPEVNLYGGIQDHGHTYFANSLIYAVDMEDIMIYGEGLIDGSFIDEETGKRHYVLQGGDPFEPVFRDQRGHTGEWFGNKAIALVRCKNVVLWGFSLVIGGHFAVIAEGVRNLLVDGILVDTTRDALDIDCCEDVTVVHSVLNSLTDDALVLKASYGAGIFMPTKNVKIEDCVVSGYDAGSVYAGLYSKNKLVATDRCGPTGRVKLGTESTCGYERITIRRVRFERSRGFALEAVDGSDLRDILFTDCQMDQVSSSPIFIRAGDRGRFPVTGNSQKPLFTAEEGNVRLDNRNWVLPDREDYQSYPPKRYTPSYRKDRRVSADGHSSFCIVNSENPVRLNPVNPSSYGNACGSSHMAHISNIEISHITITNADPRYPILIMGLTDSKISDVVLRDISVTYRGGMKMEHAVEQRQLNTNWEYTQYQTEASVQMLPWLVNSFFLKEEGLLPRADWDWEEQKWKADPYNVPELPSVYPEPSNWGILPAYGLYARHVENLELSEVTFQTMVEDERHAIVLDDASKVRLYQVAADKKGKAAKVALVTNLFRRHTHREYLLEEPYFTTGVEDLEIWDKKDWKEKNQDKKNYKKGDGKKEKGKGEDWDQKEVQEEFITEQDVDTVMVSAPAPGTPKDRLYPYPTVALPETGYHFLIPTEKYPLPLTVYRPFFEAVAPQKVKLGERLEVSIVLRDPAAEVSKKESERLIYNEERKETEFTVSGITRTCRIFLESRFPGACYKEEQKVFIWDTAKMEPGSYQVVMAADDGILVEYGIFLVEIGLTKESK